MIFRHQCARARARKAQKMDEPGKRVFDHITLVLTYSPLKKAEKGERLQI